MVRGGEVMKVEDELRMLNNELIEELDKVKAERDQLKVKASHLEGITNELTDEIDGLKEHLGQGLDKQIREQNKLLRQLLKVVL